MARAGSSKVWAVVMAAMVGATVLALMWLEVEPARSATTLPLGQGLTDSLIAQVNKPTSMAVAPDGRLFVTQKASKT